VKESYINHKIQEYLTNNGCYVVKVITANRAGVADMLACVRGQFVAIEGKTPTGVISELQKAHGEMVTSAGGLALFARSVNDVKVKLEFLL